MAPFRSIALAAAWGWSSFGLAHPSTETLVDPEIERELRGLQVAWMEAWVRQDLETLDRLLAPDFALTVSSAPDRPITREQWLGMIGRYTAQGFEYERMVVRQYGQVAVVSSTGRAIGARVDGVDRSMTFFLTDVWRNDGGRWRVVARFSSLPESDSASSRAVTGP